MFIHDFDMKMHISLSQRAFNRDIIFNLKDSRHVDVLLTGVNVFTRYMMLHLMYGKNYPQQTGKKNFFRSASLVFHEHLYK